MTAETISIQSRVYRTKNQITKRPRVSQLEGNPVPRKPVISGIIETGWESLGVELSGLTGRVSPEHNNPSLGMRNAVGGGGEALHVPMS